MGGIASLLDKMPGIGAIPAEAKAKANDKSLDRMLAVINSMTRKERYRPALIQGSRKRRIAQGSGTTIQEVNKVLKQFDQMQNPDPSLAMPMELVCCHDEMAHGETPMGRVWSFFDSREQLAAYLHWMETPQPQGQRVVKLVPKKP